MGVSREDVIRALREDIRGWGKHPPEFVTVPAAFLRDVLRLLEDRIEEDDGK